MKSISLVCLTLLTFVLCAAVAASPPEKLQLPDLQARPDRWPEQVTIKRQLNFGNAVLAAGQKVKVIEYNGGSEIGVDAGKGELFAVDPADCDFLDAANAAWQKLTPAQRGLDPAAVIADASLWPAKVICTSAFTLNSGKEIPPGQEFELVMIEPSGLVTLWEPEGKARLNAQLSQTDAVARARDLVAIDPDKRPARVAAALKSVMVDSDGKPLAKDDLDHQTLFALYYGASWCGPCRQFSPSFVKYINSVAADNPHLTVVLLSNDEKDADMLKYMKEENMPFAAVPIKAMRDSGLLMCYLKGSIPQLTIVDRYGKIVADSWNRNTYIGPKPALAQLDRSLKAGAAK
jgi:nucleoredoxin